MPDPTRAYVPNRPDVAHESFEDEVILIHFASGRYYRLDASGRVAWAQLQRGATVEELAQALEVRFIASPEDLRAAARTLVEALLSESLIVPHDASRSRLEVAVPASAPVPAPGPRAPLAAPKLEVFTDLADLLLLDPIHDTDESGWPHAKP